MDRAGVPRDRRHLAPLEPDISATLANVASLEIDTGDFTGACIAADTIDYEITTDGPTQVSFSDGSTLDFAAAGPIQARCPSPDRRPRWRRERR